MSVWTIVVAAGSGTRFGNYKQFEVVGDRRVVDMAVDGALRNSDGVVVVLPAERMEDTSLAGRCRVVAGSRSRSDSVRAGLAAVPDDAQVIVVHDGARPLATDDLYQAVIAAVESGADGAFPGVTPPDTVREVVRRGNMVVSGSTIPREQVVLAQTPQAFEAATFRQAYQSGNNASDDAGMVAATGKTVVVVEGSYANVKITVPHDLERVRSLAAV